MKCSTGKTLDVLAKGYKQWHLLHDIPELERQTNFSIHGSPRDTRHRSV